MESAKRARAGNSGRCGVGGGGLVVSLILLLLLAVQGIGQSQDMAVWLGPNQGVSFEQVSFEFSEAKEPFSTWGRLTVDSRTVAASSGLATGYINASTELGWVVWNLPFSAEDASGPISTYFAISARNGASVKELAAVISATPLPIPYTAQDGILGKADRRMVFPVGRVVWNAEGAGDLSVKMIEPSPTFADVFAGIAQNLVPLNSQYTQPNAVNVQTAVNQCFPMSIANSLQYLEDRYGMTIPHTHQPGLKGDNTLVGQLDTYAGRNASSRSSGSGVWFQPMLDGKFEYLSDNGLANALVHRHQGRGYGSAAAGQALPNGNFTRHGITSTDDGAAVTYSWLCDQIQKGEDVELVFSYDNASGQPTGGHAVRVFECGTTLGVPWIGYLHDSQQSNDSAGLETVRVNLVDLDGDGMLNLGATSREVRFAMSESRVEPLTVIPIFPVLPVVPVLTARALTNVDIVSFGRQAYDDVEFVFAPPFSAEWISGWFEGWGTPPTINPSAEGVQVLWSSPRQAITPGNDVHVGLELVGEDQFSSLIDVQAYWSASGKRLEAIPLPWQSWRMNKGEIVDLLYLSPSQDWEGVKISRSVALLPEPLDLNQLLWDQVDSAVREMGGAWSNVDRRNVELKPGQMLELTVPAGTGAVIVRYVVFWKEGVVIRVINELIPGVRG
jgi:hypothetical protein